MTEMLTLTNAEIESVENRVYNYLCEKISNHKNPSFEFVKMMAGAKTYHIWHTWEIVANRRFSTAYGAYMKAGERALAKYWERHRSMMEVA